MNASGWVVGEAETAHSGRSHAFLWLAGTFTDLTPHDTTESRALGVSDLGTVVGEVDGQEGFTGQAFMWSAGTLRRLGDLPGGAESCATGVNASGQVVGYGIDGTGRPHGFVWSEGRIWDLNELVDASGKRYEVQRAYGINDAGQIVALAALTSSGEQRGVLLTPLGRSAGAGRLSRAGAQ